VNPDQKRKCSQIFSHYGRMHQEMKLLEELAELMQAISRASTAEEVNRAIYFDELAIEEAADVLIMIQQLYGDAVNKYIEMKLQRQLERIKDEQKIP
jgi:hypothetical protein